LKGDLHDEASIGDVPEADLTLVKLRAPGTGTVAAMSIRELPKAEWGAFFDQVEALLRSSVVQVDAAGLELGDRIAAQWTRLAGISYDAGKDALEIWVYGGERRIDRPARIRLRHDEEWLQSIEIVDREGRRDDIVLREPLRVAAVAPFGAITGA
jgi:hypothetical protein